MYDPPAHVPASRGRHDRLSTLLARQTGRGLQSIAALPSNIGALEAAQVFARSARAQVAIFGPSGWGKTHLLEATAEAMRREGAVEPVRASAIDWAMDHTPGEAAAALILDDAQAAIGHPKARHRLRLGLEHRVRTGRSTLVAFSEPRPSRAVRSTLPVGREWTFAVIQEPSPIEREIVVRQMAAQHGLLLSRAMERLLAHHVFGNGHSLVGAIQTLQLEKSDWSAPTDPARACGVLHPYLVDFNGWDPLERAYEAVVQTIGDSWNPAAHWVVDVSCYLMLREMGLGEDKVSTFLGVTPSGAYARATAVERAMRDGAVASAVEACKTAVLRQFEDR